MAFPFLSLYMLIIVSGIAWIFSASQKFSQFQKSFDRVGELIFVCLPGFIQRGVMLSSNLTFVMGSRALTISFFHRSRLRPKLPFCGLHVYRGQPSRSIGWVGVT